MNRRPHKKKHHYTEAMEFPWYNFSQIFGVSYDEEMKFYNEVELWCEENLQDDYTAGDNGIYIYEEEDMMAFKLRWL